MKNVLVILTANNLRYLNMLMDSKLVYIYAMILDIAASNFKPKKYLNIVNCENVDVLIKHCIDAIIVHVGEKMTNDAMKKVNQFNYSKQIDFFSNIREPRLDSHLTESYLNCHNTIKPYKIKTILFGETKSIVPKIEKQIEQKKVIKTTAFNEFSEMCLSLLTNKEIIQKDISINSRNEAVFIEFREVVHTEQIIRNCINKLDVSWSHTIVCGQNTYNFYLDMCNRINKNIKIIKLDIANDNRNIYNNLLLTKEFWNLFVGEKLLIHQSDSYIFKSNIDYFLEYDYVGAPFSKKRNIVLAEEQVGNGGLSLRSKSKMIEVLEKVPLDLKDDYSKSIWLHVKHSGLDFIPEDIYFSQNMQNYKIGRVANYDMSIKFGMDMIYSDDCFGMHAMWHCSKDWKTKFQKHVEATQFNQETKSLEKESLEEELNTQIIDNGNTYLDGINDFCKIMNITKEDVLNNPKQEFRYFCYRHLDYVKMLNLPVINKNNFYEAVLIEFRCLPHLEFLIRNSIYKLGKNWSQTIVCGLHNYEFICNIVKNIDRNIKVTKLYYENVTQIEYNNLLFTTSFWELFDGEKLLIYQEDSCIFKNNIDDFLSWDYIGAPWPMEFNISKSGVGNGGFSLRSKSVMLECLKYVNSKLIVSPTVSKYMSNNNLSKVPEDVFFTNIMELYSIGKIADYETAKKFSTESIASDSLGGHQFWLNDVSWRSKLNLHVIKQFIPTHMTHFEHRGGWKNVLDYLHTSNLYNQNSDIVFYDILEKNFMWNPTITYNNKKWFGIVHCTQNTPEYLNIINISQLFNDNSLFLNSINNCLFLIGLSPNVVNYLQQKLNDLRIKLDVYLIPHPIENDLSIPKFSMDKFIKNNDKKLLQIGQQLRKMTSIYKLKTKDYKKMWLTGTKNYDNLHNLFTQECKYLKIKNLNINDVEMKYTDTYEEYDQLLSENIVFIDLFDAAANNTVVECILRRTPIIVNRLPGTKYYLGDDYPLFFDNIDDVPNLLTIENLQKANVHLEKLQLSSIEEFVSKMINVLNVKLN